MRSLNPEIDIDDNVVNIDSIRSQLMLKWK